MAYKPNDIYKAKRKLRPLISIPLFIVAILIILTAALFYGLQKYIVYDQDGLVLEVPFLSEQTPTPAAPSHTAEAPSATTQIDVELVIDQPDYSGVTSDAGLELEPVKALFISAEELSSGALDSKASLLSASGANALILEMKPDSGRLVWPSPSYMATAFDTKGISDLSASLAELKEQGVYLIAQISCLVDTLMATRDAPIALRDISGSVYTSSAGAWLDPYNSETRDYLYFLMHELAAMGFDEILLSNIVHPAGSVTYSQPLSITPTPITAVSSIAKRLTDLMSDSGVRVSAVLDADSLRNSLAEQTGQDLKLFATVFDRLYCYTTSDWLESDFSAVSEHFDKGDNFCRFVPIMPYLPQSENSVVPASWVIRQ